MQRIDVKINELFDNVDYVFKSEDVDKLIQLIEQ